jgi:hypothetical protein
VLGYGGVAGLEFIAESPGGRIGHSSAADAALVLLLFIR